MLAEKLGYRADERLLIVNADDFGMCGSTNRAIASLLEERAVTSTSLMVPCPWMMQAAAIASRHPEYDVGLHLTLTCEWDGYKWGPLTSAGVKRFFEDENGHFRKDNQSVARTDPELIKRECVAQIETALKLGVDLTHLDNHMASLHGAMGAGRHFVDLLIELCVRYKLPLRLPRHPFPMFPHDEALVELADSRGVVFPDYLEGLPFALEPGKDTDSVKTNAARLLRNLQPGVTELIFHPSFETEELKGITDTSPVRQKEYEVFRDPDIRRILAKENIKLIKWRDLRDLQRNE
ncbi:polysaccharide deacetylase family protein [Paenibacillus chitinolyticus]|uniref:polysaccharide deacetylase family protein n=1 Tax=Paenibacillus chitinolyticus TaxID=79263 RepID=UPI00386D316A